MKTIGMLGGLSPESTIAYYSYITHKYYETHADYAYPEIIIYSLNFDEFIKVGYEAPTKVKQSIERLSRAGADFVIAACNSLHIVFDEIADDIPIPWISIMDVTAAHIRHAGLKVVGLLGTIFTMSKGFYHKGLARHGIDTITPSVEVQERLNEIIYTELVKGETRTESRQFVLTCIDQLSQKGAQGVVLGCTELPLLVGQLDTGVRVFDTTALHAQRALDLATETGLVA